MQSRRCSSRLRWRLQPASGGEVTAEGDAVAGDPAETEPSDAETPTQPQAAPTPQAPTRPRLQAARVARVIDSDTLETADGRRIRLVQIRRSREQRGVLRRAGDRSARGTSTSRLADRSRARPGPRRRRPLRTPAPLRLQGATEPQRRPRPPRGRERVVLRRRSRPLRRPAAGDRAHREGQEARGLGGHAGRGSTRPGASRRWRRPRLGGRRRQGPRACPATARACRSPAIWTVRMSGRWGRRPWSSAGTIRTASTATTTATAASELGRLARRLLGRGRDVLVEAEEVGGVVAALDGCEPVPRFPGIRRSDGGLALVSDEVDVCPRIALA